ncbi:MAG: hypothetical protein U1C71_03525, partial [archaeon]|nr:hypothetical protein [archaeon]
IREAVKSVEKKNQFLKGPKYRGIWALFVKHVRKPAHLSMFPVFLENLSAINQHGRARFTNEKVRLVLRISGPEFVNFLVEAGPYEAAKFVEYVGAEWAGRYINRNGGFLTVADIHLHGGVSNFARFHNIKYNNIMP